MPDPLLVLERSKLPVERVPLSWVELRELREKLCQPLFGEE
jgi:hypothetical protein